MILSYTYTDPLPPRRRRRPLLSCLHHHRLRTLINYGQLHPGMEREIALATVAHLTEESKLLKTDPVYKWAQTRWHAFLLLSPAPSRALPLPPASSFATSSSSATTSRRQLDIQVST